VIDAGKSNTATGNELVLEGCTACNKAAIVGQRINQTMSVFLVEFTPSDTAAFAQRLVNKISP
jgi:hypothetical protein